MASNDWEVIDSGPVAGPSVPVAGSSPWEIVSQEPPVDVESGAPFLQRIAASFKSSPQSVANFYKTRENVEDTRVRDGEVQIKYKGKTGWVQADPKRLELGDVADMVGELPEIVGGAVGGIAGFAGGGAPTLGVGAIPGAVVGAAAGTAGGNVVKQSIGALLPGSDAETALQRAGNVAQSAAWGAVGEGAGQIVHKGVIKPTLQAMFRSGSQTVSAAEARALETSINQGRAGTVPEFRFTPGQETDSALLKGLEAGGGDLADLRSTDQLYGLQDKVVRLIDDLRGGAVPISDQKLGTEIQKTFQGIDDLMVESLEARTRAFDVLDRDAASRPLFDTPRLKETLARLQYEDTSSVGARGATAKGVAQILEELPEKMTLNDVQLYLKRWGRIGYNRGDKEFLEMLGDSDRKKMAQQMFAALSQDLDAAAALKGRPGSRLAADLRAAKDGFARGLNELSEWQDGLFARVVGDHGPESAGRIVQKLQTLQPDELKSVMTVIGTKPEVANAVKANWIETAVSTAEAKMAQRGSTEFNPKLVLDELGFGKRGGLDRARAILGDTGRNVMDDLLTVQKAANRINGAGTAGAKEAWGMLKSVSPTVGLVDFARKMLLPKYVSRTLLNPRAREELSIIANAKSPTRRVAAALTYLLGDQAMTDARQQ